MKDGREECQERRNTKEGRKEGRLKVRKEGKKKGRLKGIKEGK